MRICHRWFHLILCLHLIRSLPDGRPRVLALVKMVSPPLGGLRGRYGAATLDRVGRLLGSLRLQRLQLTGANV